MLRIRLRASTPAPRIEGGFYAEPEAALASILDDIHQMLAVILEAAGMPETRSRLLQKWAEFEESGGIGKTKLIQNMTTWKANPLIIYRS